MDRATELDIVRRAFAKQVLAEVQVDNPRLEAAFATVRREDFMGAGTLGHSALAQRLGRHARRRPDPPLHRQRGADHRRAASQQRPAVGACQMDRQRGDPRRATTSCTSAPAPATTPPSSRIWSDPPAKVTAIEVDPALAARAQANLAAFANVRVLQGDGAAVTFDAADAIYVNAGTTRPADAWLDGLAEGGRLILPLTSDKGFLVNDPPVPLERRGAFFRIERRARSTWRSGSRRWRSSRARAAATRSRRPRSPPHSRKAAGSG